MYRFVRIASLLFHASGLPLHAQVEVHGTAGEVTRFGALLLER